MVTEAPREDAEKVLRMVGWQVAIGILFILFGMEIAISNSIMHGFEPFEHGRIEALGLGGLSANAMFIIGSLNLGVAAWRFAKILQRIADKFGA